MSFSRRLGAGPVAPGSLADTRCPVVVRACYPIEALSSAVRAARSAASTSVVLVCTTDRQLAKAAEAAGAEVVVAGAGVPISRLEVGHAGRYGWPTALETLRCVLGQRSIGGEPAAAGSRVVYLDPGVASAREVNVDQAIAQFAELERVECDGRSTDATRLLLYSAARESGVEDGAAYVLRATPGWGAAESPDWRAAARVVAYLPSAGRRPISGELSGVRLVVLDFDGVMTDNRVVVAEDGTESVVCHRGDGWGIARLREAGVDVMVLSTEVNAVVAARSRKLSIDCIHGCGDKLAALRAVAGERGLGRDEIAFVGNDVNDLSCLEWVGAPIVVADAEPAVLHAARWVTSRRGGHGAVREVADWFLAEIAFGSASIRDRFAGAEA